jgi:Uma2 family endonuclease
VDSGPYVRLQVSETLYYYPDAMVTCDESLNLEATEIWTPRLVVEVLSDATEANDRGDKFANYQTLDSFEEYLLVDSRRRAVERYRRAEHGRWIYQRYGPDASVTLETIGLTCSIANFYRRTPL